MIQHRFPLESLTHTRQEQYDSRNVDILVLVVSVRSENLPSSATDPEQPQITWKAFPPGLVIPTGQVVNNIRMPQTLFDLFRFPQVPFLRRCL